VACPEKALRDPARALELARDLHRDDPGSWSHFVLGWAWIANQQWQSAIDDLGQAEMKPDDRHEYVRLILLSIAHHKLDHQSKSADYASQARAWIEANKDHLNHGDRGDLEDADRLYAELVNGTADSHPD
jgi:hypothetical protein